MTTVTGLSPKGIKYEGNITHIRGKGILKVLVRVKRDASDWFIWETDIELKRNDPMHNATKSSEHFERHLHLCSHNNISEDFVRALWQRTLADRTKAIKDCFPNRNVEKKEKPSEPDLFS